MNEGLPYGNQVDMVIGMSKRKTITDQLREAVDAAGVTRTEVARAAGVHKSMMSRFMRGEGLRSHTLDQLAAELGLELRPVRKSSKGGGNKGR